MDWEGIWTEIVETGDLVGLSGFFSSKEEKRGFDINQPIGEPRSPPLHRLHSIDYVQLLLENGANIDCKITEEESTPLHFACQTKKVDIALFLISKGAGVNVKNGFGKTPLHYAAENDLLRVAEELLSHGAEIDANSDWMQRTPLHLAAEYDACSTALILLNYGADKSARDLWDQTPAESSKNLKLKKEIEEFVDVMQIKPAKQQE